MSTVQLLHSKNDAAIIAWNDPSPLDSLTAVQSWHGGIIWSLGNKDSIRQVCILSLTMIV